MARIDDLVLRMRFDNSRFKAAAQETLGVLENLKTKLKFDGVRNAFKDSARGVDGLNRSVQNVDMSKIAGEVSGINRAFSSMGIIGRTAIGKLTVDAMNFGRKLTTSITQPLIQGGMNRAKNIEQARFQLRGLGADVAAIEAAAMAAVDGTAYGFDEAARAASQFYASNVRDAGEMEKALLAISGVAAMTSSEYSDIARIFTTVAGNGRVMASELNSFASRGLNVAAALAEARGVSEEDLRDLVSEGKVSFEEFYTAMNEAYGEHAKKAGETFSGALANAKAPLARIGADVAAVYLKSMTGLFNAIRPFLNVVHGALAPIIELINAGQSAGIDSLTRFFEGLTAGLSKGGDTGWLGNIGQGVANLLIQFGRLKQTIGDAAFRQWGERFEGVRVILDRLTAGFLRFTESVQLSDRFLSSVTSIFGALFSILGFGGSILTRLLGGLLALGDAVGRYIVPPLVDLLAYIADVVAWMVRWADGTDLAEGAIGGLTFILVGAVKMIGKFLDFVVRLVDGINDLFQRARKFVFEGTIFDPESYPEDQAAAFIGKVKDLGAAIGRIPTKGIEFLAKAFRLLGTIIEEAFMTIKAFTQSIDFSGISRIFDWIKNLKVFDSMSNPFEKLSDFKIDFSGATESIKNFGSTVRSGIGAKAGVGDKIFQPIKSGLQGLIKYIGSVDWGGVMSRIGSAISSGAKYIWDALTDIFSNIGDFVGKVDWSSVGRTVMDKIAAGITKTVEIGSKIAEAIKDSVTGAIESIDLGGIWDKIKDFGSKASEASSDFTEGLRDSLKSDDLEVEVEVVAKGGLDVELPTESKINATKSYLDSIREFFSGAFGGTDGFSSTYATFGDNVGKFLESLSTGIGNFGKSMGKIKAWITSPIQTAFAEASTAVGQGIEIVGGSLETGVTTIGDGLKRLFEGFDIHEWVRTIAIAFNAFSLLQVSNSIKGLVDAVSSVPAGIGAVLTSISDHIKNLSRAAMLAATGDFILKLAISLALLAGSLWLLSGLSWEELGKAAVGLGLLAGALLGLAFALSKMPAIAISGGAIVGIALSLLFLTGVFKILSTISWWTIIEGVIKFGLMLGMLALALHAFPEKSVLANAFALVMLAGSVLMFYGAIKLFASMEPEEWIAGITMLGLTIAGLGLAMRTFPNKQILSTVASLLILVFAMKLLADTIQQFAGMGFKTVAGGLTAVAAGLVILGAALFVLDKFMVGSKKVGLSLLAIAGAMYILAAAVKMLSGLSWEDLEGGVTALSVLMVFLGILTAFTSDADLTKTSFSLITFAGAIAIMAAALLVLSQIDAGRLLASAGALALVFVALGGVAAVVGKWKAAQGTILAMAATIGVVALALMGLAQLDVEQIKTALMGLAGALLILIVAGGLAAIKPVAAGLGILSGVLVSLGAAVALAGAGILMFGEGFGRFVDALKELGPALTKFSDEGIDALKELGGALDLETIASLNNLGSALGSIREGIGGSTGWFGASEQGLGPALTELTEGIKQLGSFADDDTSVEKAKEALKEIGSVGDEASKTLGKLREGLGATTGWFGSSEQGLGPALAELSDGLRAFANMGDEDLAGKAKKAIESLGGVGETATQNLPKLSNALGSESFLWGAIETDSVGEGVASLAEGLRAFANIDEEQMVDKAVSALEDLSAIEGTWRLDGIRNGLSSIDQLFNDKMSLGEGLDSLSEGLRVFSDLNEEATIPKAEAALKALSKLAIDPDKLKGLRDAMTEIDNWWGGDKDSLGSSLASMGEALSKFENVPSGTAISGVFSALSGIETDGIKKLRDAFQTDSNFSSDNLGQSMQALGNGLKNFDGATDNIKTTFESLSSIDYSGLETLKEKLNDTFDEGFAQGLLTSVQGLGTVKSDLESAIGGMATAIEGKADVFKNAGTRLMDGLKSGFHQKSGEVHNKAGEIARNGAKGASAERHGFETAGRNLGAGLAAGLSAKEGDVRAAARRLALAAKAETEGILDINSPSRVFRKIGLFVGAGLAQGIVGTQGQVEDASTLLAESTIDSAESTLEINSPSKRFERIGGNVTEGLAQGIARNQNDPLNSLSDMWTRIAQINRDGLEETNAINDEVLRDFGLTIDQISPYHRIERLTNHANAQYATEVKKKRIKDEEDREKAEDERQKIYEDIEDTDQAVKDAQADLDEINAPDAGSLEEDAASTKKTAEQAQKDAEQTARKKKDAERKLRDAEKAHSRAITKKDRYEYEQSGEEAGVAFKDGVAEGLIEEDDTPKYHEILADTLYDEFDRVREQASQFLGVLDAIRKMGNTFRDMGNQVNNLRRAFTRTSNSKDVRSFARNLWDSFEGATELTESMFSFLDVFEKFRPYVTMFLGLMTALPQIMQGISGAAGMLGGMVTSVGSIVGSLGGMLGPLGGMLGGLGPMVGGGIQAAIPMAIMAVLAFVGAVIAAIVATYVIWDSGGEQMILRLARSITDGIVKLSRNLPALLQDFALQMVRGITNILVDSPRMIADMIKGLMYGLIGFIRTAPSSIPKFIRALVDAFVYVITSYPAIFIDLGFAMVHAILEMFLNAIPELIMSIPQIFKDVGRAIVDGIVEGFSTAWETFKETTMQHLYNIGNVFIKFANYFREFFGKELYPLLGMPEEAAGDDILTDYERKLYNSTRDGYMSAFEDENYHPTIRPNIDMDYVNEQFAQAELDSTVSLQSAQSAGASRAQAESAAEAASVTNLNYTQNITTPKPVSTIDIYRNTQRQLDNMTT